MASLEWCDCNVPWGVYKHIHVGEDYPRLYAYIYTPERDAGRGDPHYLFFQMLRDDVNGNWLIPFKREKDLERYAEVFLRLWQA